VQKQKGARDAEWKRAWNYDVRKKKKWKKKKSGVRGTGETAHQLCNSTGSGKREKGGGEGRGEDLRKKITGKIKTNTTFERVARGK